MKLYKYFGRLIKVRKIKIPTNHAGIRERLPSFLLAQSSNNAQSLYQGNQTQQHSLCLPTLHAILERKRMQLIKQLICLLKKYQTRSMTVQAWRKKYCCLDVATFVTTRTVWSLWETHNNEPQENHKMFINSLTDMFHSQWAAAYSVSCFFILFMSSTKSKLKM